MMALGPLPRITAKPPPAVTKGTSRPLVFRLMWSAPVATICRKPSSLGVTSEVTVLAGAQHACPRRRGQTVTFDPIAARLLAPG